MRGADEDSIPILSWVPGLPNWTSPGRGLGPGSDVQQSILGCLLVEVVAMTLPRAGAQVPCSDQQSEKEKNSLTRVIAQALPLQSTSLSRTQLRNTIF